MNSALPGRRNVPTHEDWKRGYRIQIFRAFTLAVGCFGLAQLACSIIELLTAEADFATEEQIKVAWTLLTLGSLCLLLGGLAYALLRRVHHAYPYRTCFGNDGWGWEWLRWDARWRPPVFPLLILMWIAFGLSDGLRYLDELDTAIPGWGWKHVPLLCWALFLFVAPTLPYHRWPGRSEDARKRFESTA